MLEVCKLDYSNYMNCSIDIFNSLYMHSYQLTLFTRPEASFRDFKTGIYHPHISNVIEARYTFRMLTQLYLCVCKRPGMRPGVF